MNRIRIFGLISLLAAVLVMGCGGVPGLPESFDVATSATEKSEADKGTGPAGLADSTWTLTRLPDPEGAEGSDEQPRGPYGGLLSGDALKRPPVGEPIFVVAFGDAGQMVLVSGNRFFLPQFYGSEINISENWHRTTLPGVQYSSASYGLEVGGRFGLAVIVHVRFGNFFLGRAVLYAWGTRIEDQITGTFGYLLDFTDGVVRGLGTIADQYPIEGARVTE